MRVSFILVVALVAGLRARASLVMVSDERTIAYAEDLRTIEPEADDLFYAGATWAPVACSGIPAAGTCDWNIALGISHDDYSELHSVITPTSISLRVEASLEGYGAPWWGSDWYTSYHCADRVPPDFCYVPSVYHERDVNGVLLFTVTDPTDSIWNDGESEVHRLLEPGTTYHADIHADVSYYARDRTWQTTPTPPFSSRSLSITLVPEPATIALVAAGLAALGAQRCM